MEFTKTELLISLPPGYLSSFFFVLFDLLLNTALDYSFTWLASAYYHRKVRRGGAVLVRSADIPGITGYLIGSRFSPINLILTTIKATFCFFILIVELHIGTQPNFQLTSQRNVARFRFDASNTEWSNDRQSRVIRRPREFIRQCYEQTDDTVKFYSVSFNITADLNITDDLDIPQLSGLGEESVYVNESSLECLSPANVQEEDVQEVLNITGCSPLYMKRCASEKPVKVTFETNFINKRFGPIKGELLSVPDVFPFYYVFNASDLSIVDRLGYSAHNFSVSSFACAVPDKDTSYENFPVRQVTTFTSRQFGEQPQTIDDALAKLDDWSCLLIARRDNNETLIELWRYDKAKGTLTRPFPGPLLGGDVQVGKWLQQRLLFQTFHSFSWLTFSEIIVSEATVYSPFDTSFTKQRANGTSTTLPIFIVVSVVVVTVVIIVVFICVIRLNMHDERPKFNTVNGLSSIASEVQNPSENSLQKGPGITLALLQRAEGVAHFGPVCETHKVAYRTMNLEIE